jgi:hypothetical protein
MNAFSVDNEMITKLREAQKNNTGNCRLAFELIDEADKIVVKLTSRMSVSPFFAAEVIKKINYVDVLLD